MGANINSKFMCDHPLPSSAEADINEWIYTSIPPFTFMTCPGVTLSLPQFRKFLYHVDEYRITYCSFHNTSVGLQLLMLREQSVLLLRVSLSRTGRNAIDEEEDAVCITRTCAIFFFIWPYFYNAIFHNAKSHTNVQLSNYSRTDCISNYTCSSADPYSLCKYFMELWKNLSG